MRIALSIGLTVALAGCVPAVPIPPPLPAAKAAKGLIQGLVEENHGIEVRVQADKNGALSGIDLNGKSLGRDLKALRQGVVPLVAASNRAGKTPKANIAMGAEVRHVDFQRVLAALTNDIVEGEYRYSLVEEWELKVEGSPIVLTARSGAIAPQSQFDSFDGEVMDETLIIEGDNNAPPPVVDDPFKTPEVKKKKKLSK